MGHGVDRTQAGIGKGHASLKGAVHDMKHRFQCVVRQCGFFEPLAEQFNGFQGMNVG